MEENLEYVGCFDHTWDILTDIWYRFRQSLSSLREPESNSGSETLREIADSLIRDEEGANMDNDDDNNNNDDIELVASPDIIIELDDDLTISKVYIRYYQDTPFILLSFNKNNIEPVQEVIDNWFVYQEDEESWYYVCKEELFMSLSKYYQTVKDKNIDPLVVLNNVRKIKFTKHNGKMTPSGYRFKK